MEVFVLLNVHIDEAGYPEAERTIHDVSFTISGGEQIGLIGPNGAGKSTTIKSIVGLLKNVCGNIDWKDQYVRYAYVPEQPIFYSELTLWEHFSLAAAAFSFKSDTFEERVNELLKTFDMENEKHHLLDSFSKGMQQKAMLMIALAVNPDLFIIDEPFIGLDPQATKTLLSLLDEERGRGAAVLMSTHVLDTAEKYCDRFILLSNGQMIANGDLMEIQKRAKILEGSLLDCFDQLTGGSIE